MEDAARWTLGERLGDALGRSFIAIRSSFYEQTSVRRDAQVHRRPELCNSFNWCNASPGIRILSTLLRPVRHLARWQSRRSLGPRTPRAIHTDAIDPAQPVPNLKFVR